MNKNKIKKELELYLIGYEGGYDHRNAIRYLSKRKPWLWDEITKITDFLPLDAKAKQRCWHILNEAYKRPTCPTTGDYVKWFDNRYLIYISLSAKSSNSDFQKKCRETYERNNPGHKGHWSADPKIKKQKKATFEKNGTFIPINEQNVDNEYRARRAKEEFRKKYGVDNPMDVEEFRQKLMDPDKNEKERYYEEIAFYTRHSWYNHYSKINPNDYKRGNEYQLDHIFSRYEGWKQNISPEVIGHWTNLQMLEKEENRAKDIDCWKNKEQLFEDYNKYTQEHIIVEG